MCNLDLTNEYQCWCQTVLSIWKWQKIDLICEHNRLKILCILRDIYVSKSHQVPSKGRGTHIICDGSVQPDVWNSVYPCQRIFLHLETNWYDYFSKFLLFETHFWCFSASKFTDLKVFCNFCEKEFLTKVGSMFKDFWCKSNPYEPHIPRYAITCNIIECMQALHKKRNMVNQPCTKYHGSEC